MRKKRSERNWRGLFVLLFSLSLVGVSEAAPETIPKVKILDNDSGIKVDKVKIHGPTWLIGGDQIEHSDPPDIPSGVLIYLHNYPGKQRKKVISKGRGTLRVVSVERIGNYDHKYHSVTNSLKTWRSILDLDDLREPEVRTLLYKQQLSEIPWINAGRCFHGKLRIRAFPWGKAVFFLTTYVQGSTGGPVNNASLFLVAQGVTHDGLYAVNAHFDISHSKLPASTWVEETKPGKVYFSVDTETKEAEKWLDAQPDDSFSPTFDQFEEFLRAVEIRPGKRKGKRVRASHRFLKKYSRSVAIPSR